MKILIHILKKHTLLPGKSDYYIKGYHLLTQKNVRVILAYSIESSYGKEICFPEIQNTNIQAVPYAHETELVDLIRTHLKNDIQIYTNYEDLFDLANRLKKQVNQNTTEIDGLFTSKYLQRKNLWNFDKNMSVGYEKYCFSMHETCDISQLLGKFNFPIIVKPSSGSASRGVQKVHSLSDVEYAINNIQTASHQGKNNCIVLEEYIEGQMYTIDYFVDENGKIYKTALVKTNTLKEEYGIDDFGITSEISGISVHQDIPENILDNFLLKNVQACKIKNTFVHHEFKKTKNGSLKTIELNGRIGGYRSEIYDVAYGINMFEILFDPNSFLTIQPKTNYQFIGLFPKEQTGKPFLGLNQSFIDKIKQLKSYYHAMVKDDYIGKKIGFTKNGYRYFGTVRLAHTDITVVEQDYKFIKNNLEQNIIYGT